MPNALIALGGAFLVAGALARLGRRVGLPTIPFFMAAGILVGPNTPGFVLVENPYDTPCVNPFAVISCRVGFSASRDAAPCSAAS